MESSLHQRVKKGAALLDKEQPGWASKVNPDGLDMRSGSYCILGQAFGEYEDGTDHLDVEGRDYGFDLVYEVDDVSDWRILDALWIKEVQKRTNPGFFRRLFRRNK